MKTYVYFYTTCCKCGKDKPRSRRSRCKACMPPRKKRLYTHCIKCKAEKDKPNSVAYCKSCSKPYNYVKKEIDREGMIEFVNRVEKRGHNVTTKELFVDLIGYYSQITRMADEIDNYTTNEQLAIMWERVEGYVKTGKY